MAKRFRGIGVMAVVAAIVVLGGITALLLLPFGGQERPATVKETVNEVNTHPHSEDEWQPATVGMKVYGGGQVRTGRASCALLELLEGMVRLSADSLFTVKSSTIHQDRLLTAVFLREGRLWVNLTTSRPHEFTVETGNAVAAVRDTRFSVKVAAGETLVSVAEGKVVLTAQEQSVTVAAGQQATVEPGRPPMSPEPMSDGERELWAIEGEMPEMAPPTSTATPTERPTLMPTATTTPIETSIPPDTSTPEPMPILPTTTRIPLPPTPTLTSTPTRTPSTTPTPSETPTRTPTYTLTPTPPAAATGVEYIISGGPDPGAGIFVDDILRVFVNTDLVAEVSQHGRCCPPVPPIRFIADAGDILRVQAQDANACYSLEALWLQRADGSYLTQLTGDIIGSNCDSEPPEQIFFDQTFTLP